MDEVLRSGPMEHCLRATSKMTNRRALEGSSTEMGTCTKGNGFKGSQMAWAVSPIRMVILTTATGAAISITDMGVNSGPMVPFSKEPM